MRGAILAGGAASRFGGEPKGLWEVGGERILDRAVRALQTAVGSDPLIVANAADADDWVQGLSVVKDVRPRCGSLGGIFTVVSSSREHTLIVAWDMPFLSPELLRALIQKAEANDVFLPESTGPLGMEPLCGVYGSACAGPIERALDEKDFRAWGFHNQVRFRTLPLAEVEQIGDPTMMFFNVNTPDDVQTAEELWKNRHV
jgi:molybdopterin-guanine dinucleotide biosynthesis protein A